MMDQQNFERSGAVASDATELSGADAAVSVATLATGLTLGVQDQLTIRRIERGKGYAFIRADGSAVRHSGTIKRLSAMAMPPADATAGAQACVTSTSTRRSP